ncbi:hypothetical protein ACFX2I_013178 [Malus domestica]
MKIKWMAGMREEDLCVCARKKKKKKNEDWAETAQPEEERAGAPGEKGGSPANQEKREEESDQPEEGKEERRKGEKRRREERNGLGEPARPAGVLHPFPSKFHHFSNELHRSITWKTLYDLPSSYYTPKIKEFGLQI